MNIPLCILACVIAYLLGCIPNGVWIANAYSGVDIRRTGSGNSGTTNVLRTLGWVPSVLTLIGDALKGVLGAWIGLKLGGEIGMLLGGIFSVLGHDFPVFLKFKGGKGIATSFGAVLVILPQVAPWLVVIVFVLVALTRIMSVGTLSAALAFPFLFMLYAPRNAYFALYIAFSIALALLAFYCHRSNLVRLAHREENKLDFKKISDLSKKYWNARKQKKEQ